MRIIFFVVLAALTACQPQPTSATFSAESLRGQWVFINYWAQWCKPCIEEIPELNRLNSEHDHITVLGVNYDGASAEQLAEQEAALGITFQTLSEDPAAQLGTTRPVVLPTTLVLNPQGELLHTLVGPQTEASLLAAIDKH
ncbi:TlpA family protein disulfide reductase [Parahaliea sp. F7430]|uniref:TlpA family protein disulfide reductase n=1 Tax=Sediminihaliea albiluteola TaxID=2758564 RepID=A0A7W2YJ52_9GAMM|nr:TlpA disulfide reductase family protein [Sediminihaliea albiluteola]MBA6412790.1 TlpA family protein disulfide reductase [Sediminihaliea albiluteola]